MEKVRQWCGQPLDRGRLKNRTERSHRSPRTDRYHTARRQRDNGVHNYPKVTGVVSGGGLERA